MLQTIVRLTKRNYRINLILRDALLNSEEIRILLSCGRISEVSDVIKGIFGCYEHDSVLILGSARVSKALEHGQRQAFLVFNVE